MRKCVRALASKSRDTLLHLSLVVVVFSYSPLLFAGGIEIDKRSIAFDNDPTKREFARDTEIVLTYGYTAWAYAGKPHEFVVFELNRLTEAGVPSQQLNYFVTEIHAKHGFGVARFSLPEPNSIYRISYHIAAFFSHSSLNAALHGGLLTSSEDKTAITKFYTTNYSGTETLTDIRSLAGGMQTSNLDMMTIYFRPGLKQQIDRTIVDRKPPTFEWGKGPDSAPGIHDEEYSYRLDPLEDWSNYSAATKATYYLLTPGDYVFEVRARYTFNGHRKETSIASLPIQVTSVISAPPPMDALEKGVKVSPTFWEEHHYPDKVALLIAVSEYADPTFSALPYVKDDINLIARTLQQQGFRIEKLETDTTRPKIEEAMNGLLGEVKPRDAVLVYFSGHGTSLGLSNFLVSTDCNSNKKRDTCIAYDWLKGWIDKVMDKGALHLFVALDACQAGLGLWSKSGATTPLETLAYYPGALMMTAGLMEQEAHIDLQDGVSVFSEYFAKGLSGAADWNKDGIITLSELLAYVQNNVSKHVSEMTNSKESQVPVMGKVKGAGEMLFRVP